ncbi:MAG: SelL-related redox protein [Planctomycetota bacterium]
MAFDSSQECCPRWLKLSLAAAATYNIVWGSWVILRPNDLFDWTGLDRPLYGGIWQCVGMIVGVYGIGYAIAASDPFRHWPVVLVGFLGKILGPIGMIQSVFFADSGASGRFPPSWLWVNLTNDVIWWIPFGACLYLAFKYHNDVARTAGVPQLRVAEANENATSQHGESVASLSQRRPTLVLFLRHSGCTFCREALADVQASREAIQRESDLAIVHMGSEDDATRAFFASYGLEDVHRVSDPSCTLYEAYELERGRLSQLFGARVWWRGFVAAILRGHGIGKLGGDGFRMSGVFLVHRNKIIHAERHRTVADRSDYCDVSRRLVYATR